MTTKKTNRYAEYAKPKYYVILAFTLLYMAAFGAYFLISGNTEFLFYLPVLLLIVLFVVLTLPVTKLPAWALWSISVLQLLHVAGGGVKVHGDVLYNLILVPIIDNGPNGVTIWRFDQLVHPYGSAVAALVIYFFLAPRTTLKNKWMIVIIALAAMGVGSLNEVLEFLTTVLIPGHTDVGGYDNTCLDLCSNLIGGTFGAWFATWLWGKNPPKK
jgi:hypothetical protein